MEPACLKFHQPGRTFYSSPIEMMTGQFGSYYWSPDAWSEHSDGLRQADAGISFRPVSLLDVTLGYRYAAIQGKNGAKDNVIADGLFVGGGVHF